MKETMTSRERVMRIFAHEKPDRVAIDYSANSAVDTRFKAFYGLRPDQQEELMTVLGCDIRMTGWRYTGPRLHPEVPGRQVDPMLGIHTRWIEHKSGGYFDYCDFPLAEADEDMVAAWPMPSPDDFDTSFIRDFCARNDDKALCIAMYGDLINGNGMLRGMEQTLIDLVTDEPAGLLLAKRRFDLQIEVCDRMLDAAKGRIDFVWIGEDLGTQMAPIVSPDTFRRNIKPYYRKYTDMLRSHGVKIMIHTCGSSSWAYDVFIEMGVNAVDTLQPECKNMAPEYLVEKFGGRLAFHGCMSTAGVLAYGTPEDVRAEVKRLLEIMMPTDSYMFSPTHQIQDNTPTENLVAMYEAVKEFGFYS